MSQLNIKSSDTNRKTIKIRKPTANKPFIETAKSPGIPSENTVQSPDKPSSNDDITLKSEPSTNTNEHRRKMEQIEFKGDHGVDHDFLYPTLNDPAFSAKIASHTEFNDTQYDGEIRDIQTYADKMCKAEFELLPHQLFVKNFLSFQTPYNSLLLYHGLVLPKKCVLI